MTLSVLLFLAGALLLYAGAEGLVRGSIILAKALGIRPIVIGLTVVAFGTSAPEFIVSLVSAIAGSSDIALGNVVGSNIANIGLILGIAALLRPVDIDTHLLSRYFPVMFVSSVLLYVFALGDSIRFFQGVFLLIGIIAFTWYLIRQNRKIQDYDSAELPVSSRDDRIKIVHVVMVIGGVGLLVSGSHLMVESGVTIARALGVSEFAIGITLVAVGTSLPELAASIVAVLKKNTGIIIGNIIGSNIFNVLFVVGGVSAIHPILVNVSARVYELPVMIAFTIILFVFMRTGFVINRTEGVVLLVVYIVFIMFLF